MEEHENRIQASECALSLTFALGACGGDSFSPTVETVAGNYTAGSLTTSSSVGTTDLLARPGSTVDIALAKPTAPRRNRLRPRWCGGWQRPRRGPGWDVDAVGNTVTFNQTGDTFIRDVQFTAGRNRLSGEGTFSGTIVRLVMIDFGRTPWMPTIASNKFAQQ